METRRTGLEPATTGSTGRYSNQLSYRPNWGWDSIMDFDMVKGYRWDHVPLAIFN